MLKSKLHRLAADEASVYLPVLSADKWHSVMFSEGEFSDTDSLKEESYLICEQLHAVSVSIHSHIAHKLLSEYEQSHQSWKMLFWVKPRPELPSDWVSIVDTAFDVLSGMKNRVSADSTPMQKLDAMAESVKSLKQSISSLELMMS